MVEAIYGIICWGRGIWLRPYLDILVQIREGCDYQNNRVSLSTRKQQLHKNNKGLSTDLVLNFPSCHEYSRVWEWFTNIPWISPIHSIVVTLQTKMMVITATQKGNLPTINSNANAYNPVSLYSPSLGGPVPLYKLPVTEVVYVTSEQATSRPVARDPEHTANWMQTNALSTGNTESGHLGDHSLLPSSRLPVDRDPKGNRD